MVRQDVAQTIRHTFGLEARYAVIAKTHGDDGVGVRFERALEHQILAQGVAWASIASTTADHVGFQQLFASRRSAC